MAGITEQEQRDAAARVAVKRAARRGGLWNYVNLIVCAETRLRALENTGWINSPMYGDEVASLKAAVNAFYAGAN